MAGRVCGADDLAVEAQGRRAGAPRASSGGACARVLAVTGVPPKLDHPNGFSPRHHRLLSAVARRWPLDLAAVHTGEKDWQPGTFLPAGFPAATFTCESVGGNPLNAPGTAAAIRRVGHYLFGGLPYAAHPRRLRAVGPAAAGEPPALGIFVLPHNEHLALSLPPGVPAVCLVEEGFERSMAWTTAGMASDLSRWLIASERNRVGALHRRVAARGARFVVISEEEREWLARSIPRELITVIPHGVDCGYFQPVDAPREYDVGIFGQLGEPRVYEPAAELHARLGARAEGRGLRWAFVGRHPAPALASLASDRVAVTGEVPDVRPYYARTGVAVVPSMVGTGVKTTVLQAWAMGRPVVATRFALNGLPARDGENVLVAGDVEELADHTVRLLSTPELYARLVDAGLRTVRTERDTRRLGEDFADLCAAAMQGGAAR